MPGGGAARRGEAKAAGRVGLGARLGAVEGVAG